jgi:dihydropteroate synthase
MATVSVIPDSFSDGGVHSDINAALSYVSSSIAAGATIIDVVVTQLVQVRPSSA